MPTNAILNQIRSLGFVVTTFHSNGAVEMKAVQLKGDGAPIVVQCGNGVDDDSAYRAACLLADAVGFDLEDGFRPRELNFAAFKSCFHC